MLKDVNFDSKKYIIITLVGVVSALTIERFELYASIIVAGICLASAINHLILFKVVRSVVRRQSAVISEEVQSKKSTFGLKVSSLLLLKMLILGGTFYMAVAMFRDKVLIALLMYIFELIVFVLSIKK